MKHNVQESHKVKESKCDGRWKLKEEVTGKMQDGAQGKEREPQKVKELKRRRRAAAQGGERLKDTRLWQGYVQL